MQETGTGNFKLRERVRIYWQNNWQLLHETFKVERHLTSVNIHNLFTSEGVAGTIKSVKKEQVNN